MQRPPRSILRSTLLSGLAALAIHASAHAAAFDINLAFSSLPSAQGWTYTPAGSHSGAVEANVFSVAGATLTQNSMAEANGVSGGSIIYVRTPGVTTSEPKQIRARVRCLEVEGSVNAPAGQGGICFGFSHGSVQYGFALTPTGVYRLGSSTFVAIGGTYDNSTAFHDYLFDWAPGGTFSIYRDGALVGSSSGGFALAVNRIFFGDGTGGANAHAQITEVRFLQGAATATASTSWGRVKALYRH